MPVSVPVTFGKYMELEVGLKSMGFSEIVRGEMAVTMRAYGVRPPRAPRAGEIGFKYVAHGYVVKVWTTCMRGAVEKCRRAGLHDGSSTVAEVVVGRPAGKDVGWIVIADHFGRAEYFARPTLRTKNFVTTLLRRTWITKRRVERRPLCPSCHKFMWICTKQSGATFWACRRRQSHPDGRSVFKDWDASLPPKALKLARAWRKSFSTHLKKARQEGKEPRRASTIRTPWTAEENPF